MDYVRRGVHFGWVVCLTVAFYVLLVTATCIFWTDAAADDDDDDYSARIVAGMISTFLAVGFLLAAVVSCCVYCNQSRVIVLKSVETGAGSSELHAVLVTEGVSVTQEQGRAL